jgi:hypothetical protein
MTCAQAPISSSGAATPNIREKAWLTTMIRPPSSSAITPS